MGDFAQRKREIIFLRYRKQLPQGYRREIHGSRILYILAPSFLLEWIQNRDLYTCYPSQNSERAEYAYVRKEGYLLFSEVAGSFGCIYDRVLQALRCRQHLSMRNRREEGSQEPFDPPRCHSFPSRIKARP